MDGTVYHRLVKTIPITGMLLIVSVLATFKSVRITITGIQLNADAFVMEFHLLSLKLQVVQSKSTNVLVELFGISKNANVQHVLIKENVKILNFSTPRHANVHVSQHVVKKVLHLITNNVYV